MGSMIQKEIKLCSSLCQSKDIYQLAMMLVLLSSAAVYTRCAVFRYLGPVVQSIVSLTSSLVVKMLTVLVSTISNAQVFVLKNVSS